MPELRSNDQRISGRGLCLERVHGMYARNGVGEADPRGGSGEPAPVF